MEQIVQQFNDLLHKDCSRLKSHAVDVAPYEHYDTYLAFYANRGHRFIVPIFHRQGKTFIRSILRETGARKVSWLINGQPSTGTKQLRFYGENRAPEIGG